MNNRWLGIRESAVSLLRIFAVLVVLFLLSRLGIRVFTQLDNGNAWNNIVILILDGLTKAAYYGGIVFALSWIVSLIGKQTEEHVRSGWLNNRESAVSLLKLLALLIVLLCLSTTGIGTLISLDRGDPWYYTVDYILPYIIQAAYYGGTLFALSWIISLIGNQSEENVRNEWRNNRESAVSLLRLFALLIVLLSLLLAVVQGFTRGYTPDWHLPWEFTVDSILYTLFSAAYYGGIMFVLSWIVSLIGQRNANEVPNENIT